MRLDLNGQPAQNVGRDAHATLHFRDRRGRGFEVEQRIVRLAALLDLVGQRTQAPVLGLADLAAAFFDNGGVFFGQCFDLLGRNILARQEDMLI